MAGAFFFALGALDVTLLLGHYGQLGQLKEMVNDFLESMRINAALDGRLFALLTLNFLCSWLCTVITAYLADVLSTCVLSGKKYNGWVSLLIFILLSWGLSALQHACTARLVWDTALIVDAAVALGCSVLMYIATAFLMDRHLSV